MRRLHFIKTLALSLGLLGVLGLSTAPFAGVVYAADDSIDSSKQASCEGIGGSYVNGKCEQTDSANLNDVIGNIVNFLSVIIGIVAVIMIIVAGFKYMTASGDSSKLTSAKSTLIYAIIGLVIVFFSQVIVKFVINTAANGPESSSTTVE